MAISAYIGVPGSGKSYEVVKSVIIPALIKGRRVVTNVYGLQVEDIYSFCRAKKKAKGYLSKNKDDSDIKIGELICVTNEQCKDPEFLPYKDSVGTLCQPGDLVCLDECWRFWDSDKDIHAHHRSFVAEHRHFVDDKTGLSCDLVVVNQAIVGIPRFIKDRIESTFRMTKLKAVGLGGRYRVDVFGGVKTFKSNMISHTFSKYEKKYYSLYKSYDAENASEDKVDDRGNIFKNPTFIFSMVFAVAILYFSISTLINMFTVKEDKKPVNVTHETVKSSGADFKQAQAQVIKPLSLSKTWRIQGSFQDENGSYVIIKSSNGIRIEPKSNFSYSGSLLSGVIDGEIVTTYSGDTSK